MKGFLTACAVAGTALACAAPAAAQRPAELGDGAPPGQISVQLYSFSRYISNGTGEINPPAPATPMERLERVLAFLQSKGVKNAELYAAGFPPGIFPDTNPATPVNYEGLRQLRALGDKYGVRFPTRGGQINESTWDDEIAAAKILGQQAIGAGGPPGLNNATYESLRAQAELFNRLGKRSVEAGVGPLHFHNHGREFQLKFVDDGVLKSAWEILLDHTDPRYVTTVLDLYWLVNARAVDPVAIMNKYKNRIIGFHVKDGQLLPTGDGALSPVGQGDMDFRPLFAPAKNLVRYYTYEYDPPNTAGFNPFAAAEQSFAAMKGDPAPTIQSETPVFAATGVGSTSAPAAVTITNTGDAPLIVTAVGLTADADHGGDQTRDDFQLGSQTCTAAPVPAGGTCTVNVAFRPSRTHYTSVARVTLTSNADDSTEFVRLAARSTGDVSADVSGTVPATLSLSLDGPASLGTFVPGVAAAYEKTVAATVTTTSGDATLSVSDADAAAPGRLVNGSFALPQPLEVKAANAANPNGAFAPLGASAGALLSWSGPVSNDAVTIGFRQRIGANDALRTGSYGKRVTFTLSTTQP